MKKHPSAADMPTTDHAIACSWQPAELPLYRPTWAEIDRAAFRKNFRAAASLCARGTRIIAVVKANAYGHGAAPLSAIAVKEGAWALGVSSVEEGIHLRRAGIKSRILILGSIYPLENFHAAADYRLTPTISSLAGLAELARAARERKEVLPFHLKIDTGMGRVGIYPETAPAIFEKIAARREVALEGVYMHFAAADCDSRYTAQQMQKFHRAVRCGRSLGLRFVTHAANSAALLTHRKYHFDAVRPGLVFYGLSPFEDTGKRFGPVLSWKTRIVYLKRAPKKTSISYSCTYVTRRASLIATLPVGYADGYSRQLSNRGEVLVRGQRCRVVGRVTMDMTMVDVTGVKGVSIGDEAVLIGTQKKERISAEDIAGLCGTINYEVTCAISYRVPRIVK